MTRVHLSLCLLLVVLLGAATCDRDPSPQRPGAAGPSPQRPGAAGPSPQRPGAAGPSPERPGAAGPSPQRPGAARPSPEGNLPSSPPPGCAVTVPGSAGTPPTTPELLFGWASSYGNPQLWVGGLPPGGVLLVEPGGVLGSKLGWWRITRGLLEITGRRLDAPGPALVTFVPEGYGDGGFQSSGVEFPTQGCWEVTGTVGDARLTFVMYVARIGAPTPSG